MRRTLTGAAARYDGGLREVGPGLYAWMQPNGSWGEANAGLVVGDGESLVVDTLFDEVQARRMLTAMAPHVSTAPIRFVVNTHSDGDHWWGNAVMPRDAEIITSTASRAAMRAESTPAEFSRLDRLARVASGLPGYPGRLGRYTHGMFAPFRFVDVRPRHPDRDFTGRHSLTVGGRRVDLVEVGPAHTSGDVIAHVPDAGVVFAGDMLFVGSTPVLWHGPAENAIAALKLLRGLNAKVYVPGHGPPATTADIAALTEYWTWVADSARGQRNRGRSAWAAARDLARSDEFRRWRTWECPERMVINVATEYHQLAGHPPPAPNPVRRARLFAQVAALAKEIAGQSG